MEKKITRLLLRIGIPSHLKGFAYLRECILMSIKSPRLMVAVTQKLYPAVAAKYDTTPCAVERSVRSVVAIVRKCNDAKLYDMCFGDGAFESQFKPTNAELISSLATRLSAGTLNELL